MTFYRGQKVVCVDDGMYVRQRPNDWLKFFRRFRLIGHNLNKGDIYIVTTVSSLKDDVSGKVYVGLLLAEAWHFGFRSLPFPSFQFRSLVERKTDISVFTAMLDRSKQTERA